MIKSLMKSAKYDIVLAKLYLVEFLGLSKPIVTNIFPLLKTNVINVP